MATGAKRICTYPGCNTLVKGSSRCRQHPYSVEHRKEYRQRVKRRRSDPNNPIHFYTTPEWRKLRDYHLRKEPLCRACAKQGRVKAGNTVDHIVPITQGGERMDDANLQTLCKPHHTAKTNRERATQVSSLSP